MLTLITRDGFSYYALANSFSVDGRKIRGSFGSMAITGTNSPRICVTAVMTVLWICELVKQKKEVKVFTFMLGGAQYRNDKAHYLYCVLC